MRVCKSKNLTLVYNQMINDKIINKGKKNNKHNLKLKVR